MADGQEERREREARREEEKKKDRSDRVYESDDDPWQPERVDS